MPVIKIINDNNELVSRYSPIVFMGAGYFDPHDEVEAVLVAIRKHAARSEQEAQTKAERKASGRVRKAAQCFMDWLNCGRPTASFPVELAEELDSVSRTVILASSNFSVQQWRG